MTFGSEELEAHRLQSLLERVAGGLVAGPGVVESLAEHPVERCLKTGDHRDRRGVVIGTPAARLADVAAEQPEVDIPGLRVGVAALKGSIGDRERCEPGSDAEAFLGACVADIDAPVIGKELAAGDRGDGVGDQQRIALDLAECLDVGAHAGRGLGVDRGDDLGVGVRVGNAIGIDGGAVLVIDTYDLSAATRRDLTHPLAKETVHRDDCNVAGSRRC